MSLRQITLDNQISIEDLPAFNNDIIDEMMSISDVPVDIDLGSITLSTAWSLARYRLDAGQSKVLRYLISKIQPEDENFKTYFFSIRELAKTFGISEKTAYSELPKATLRMLEQTIEFKGNAESRLLQMNLLSVADYEGGTLKIKFNPILKPVLLQLKDELSYSYLLKDVLSFSCGYSFRWFDILKTMQKNNEFSRDFSISEIRNIFKIGDSEYSKFSDFRKRVIDPPCDELKEKSLVYFEYEEKRIGKKVENLTIFLKIKD